MLKIVRDNQELAKQAIENNCRDYTFCWNVKDVSRELKCSTRLISSLVSKDRIPYAKVGRLVRFSPARIAEWILKGGSR